jgi:hypothetical protein
MSWQGWLDVTFLQKVSRHTFNCAAAMLSWILLFWLGRKGIQSDRIHLVLESTETIVLIVTIGVFAIDFVCDLVPPRVQGLVYNMVRWLRNVFRSDVVLA